MSFDPNTTYVGLDVHKDSIYVAAIFPSTDPHKPFHFKLRNDPKAAKRIVKRLNKHTQGPLLLCYEAGCCGFYLQRQFQSLGTQCQLIAPSLIPVKKGDKVKTDRRDAAKLARHLRSGELTEVHPPSPEQESVRRLARLRQDARNSVTRVKQQILSMLLSMGVKYEGNNWTQAHRRWLKSLEFAQSLNRFVLDSYLRALREAEDLHEDLKAKLIQVAETKPYKASVEALVCFKGIQTVQAMTLLTELHDIARFRAPKSLMSFLGLIPSEKTSGGSEGKSQGTITKAGNRHLRKALVMIARNYRRRSTSKSLADRRKGKPPEIVAIGKKAEARLARRYSQLVYKNKAPNVATVAVARELAGFLWAALRTSKFGPKLVRS